MWLNACKTKVDSDNKNCFVKLHEQGNSPQVHMFMFGMSKLEKFSFLSPNESVNPTSSQKSSPFIPNKRILTTVFLYTGQVSFQI